MPPKKGRKAKEDPVDGAIEKKWNLGPGPTSKMDPGCAWAPRPGFESEKNLTTAPVVEPDFPGRTSGSKPGFGPSRKHTKEKKLTVSPVHEPYFPGSGSRASGLGPGFESSHVKGKKSSTAQVAESGSEAGRASRMEPGGCGARLGSAQDQPNAARPEADHAAGPIAAYSTPHYYEGSFNTAEGMTTASMQAEAGSRPGAYEANYPADDAALGMTQAGAGLESSGECSEYLAVAETVEEPPIVTGVEAPDDEAIYEAALKGAKVGAATEQRMTNRKLCSLVALVFVVLAVVVGIAVPFATKKSDAIEITEVNIFNAVYETKHTTQVILASGGLSGTLPTEIFLLKELTMLDLSENSFTGTLPSELATLPKLAQVYISDNDLTGSLPSELGTMTQLTELSLHGNKEIGGTIPSEFSQLMNLSVLWLYDTDLSGSVPTSLCTSFGPSDFRIDCGEIACDCCMSSNLVDCERISTPDPTPIPTPDPSYTGSITLNKDEYIQGQTIRATFSDPSQLDHWDDVLIFPSEVTDYINTPAVKSADFGSGAGLGDSGVTTMRIDFVETGTFKLIVRAGKNADHVFAESPPFTIVETSATLTLNKDEYIQGQTIRATFSDPSQLDNWDDVLVFPSEVTDYVDTPAVKSVNFGGGAGLGDSGVMTMRIDFVETGTFKLIVRANKKLVFAESPPFTINKSSATLTLDKDEYIQGQTIRATFSDPSQLNNWDDVLVFPSEVTDYVDTPAVKSVNFGGGAGLGDSGITTVLIDFDAGSFKLIVRANENLVFAESASFVVTS